MLSHQLLAKVLFNYFGRFDMMGRMHRQQSDSEGVSVGEGSDVDLKLTPNSFRKKTSTAQNEVGCPRDQYTSNRVCNNIWQLHCPPIDQSVCQFPHTALTQHQYMKVKVESAISNK